MVRKIGFGDESSEPTSPVKKSVADQAMDRFRKKARNKERAQAQRAENKKNNLAGILFLILWLMVWTFAILGASYSAYQTKEPFVLIWVAFAAFAWFKGFQSLVKKFKGETKPFERPENF